MMMNSSPSSKSLIVIVGPTASGKTALAIKIARELKTEIVSADSRQFYREMSIGTAKPTGEELAQVKHHFINSHSINENFSVGDYEKQCLELLAELFKKYDNVVLVGGSGLYIKAICEGFDELPKALPGVREKLNQLLTENGIAFLQEQLKLADPAYYAQVDLNNPQRLIRALEVFESTGKQFSAFRKAEPNARPFSTKKIGIDLPRQMLYDRINLRIDQMLQDGLLEEVIALIPYRHLNALNTVGYSELFDYFDGNTDLETSISLIKQNTRRFAKRQMTWFRKDKDVVWYNNNDLNLTSILQSGLYPGFKKQ